MNLSLNQTLLTFLLYVRQTWITQLILAISLWEVIFLYSKRFLILICMVKDGLPFARDLSLENSADSYLCFRLALLHSVSYFFFLYRSPSSSLCTVFDFISSNIDEVLSINASANVFVFVDFNVHHKDWLTYSGGTDRSSELCYNFSISNDLTQMVNFRTRIPDCDSHILLLWICFFILMPVFALQWFPSILVMLLSQFPQTFHQIDNRIPHFIA